MKELPEEVGLWDAATWPLLKIYFNTIIRGFQNLRVFAIFVEKFIIFWLLN